MKPCLAYAGNSQWRQLQHVAGELLEVAAALLRRDYAHAAEELVDVQVACETLLHILGYSDLDRQLWRAYVDNKNEVRGYHKEAE